MARVVKPTNQPPVLEFASWKTQAHQTYRKADNTIVPGVTTALGQWNKPQLVGWANNLGLQGIDNRKYVDEAARVGELGHYLIECAIKDRSPEDRIPDFSANQMSRAQHALAGWRTWCDQFRSIETVASEFPLVSEEYGYGGKIDWLVKINDVLTLVDFKTSSGIFRDHRVQACAYWKLLQEHGYKIGGLQIVKVPRNPDETVMPVPMSGAEVLAGWQIFEHLLSIYRLTRAHQAFK